MKNSRVAAAQRNALHAGERFRQHGAAERIAAMNKWVKRSDIHKLAPASDRTTNTSKLG